MSVTDKGYGCIHVQLPCANFKGQLTTVITSCWAVRLAAVLAQKAGITGAASSMSVSFLQSTMANEHLLSGLSKCARCMHAIRLHARATSKLITLAAG